MIDRSILGSIDHIVTPKPCFLGKDSEYSEEIPRNTWYTRSIDAFLNINASIDAFIKKRSRFCSFDLLDIHIDRWDNLIDRSHCYALVHLGDRSIHFGIDRSHCYPQTLFPRKRLGIFRGNSEEHLIYSIDRCVFEHKRIDRCVYKKTFEILFIRSIGYPHRSMG